MNIDLERHPAESDRDDLEGQEKELETTVRNYLEMNVVVHTKIGGDEEVNHNGDKLDVNENADLNYCVNDSDNNDVTDRNEDVSLEPREGMEFESHEEAFEFYKEYARLEGFGVSKRNSRRSRISKKFIDAKFACCRYGTKQASDRVSRPRPTAKIDCKAAMHVKRKVDGTWFVYSFIKDHNHELSRDHAHFFRCHRDSNPNKDKFRNSPIVGVQVSEICPLLPSSFGGYQNGNCFDGGNDLGKGPRLAIDVGDAQAMNEFFVHMQEENPNFFYALDLDGNQHLRNVFWVDAKGRHDYLDFSDVISFDTTYATNGYKMPIALFVGVNHHGHFILLGCALIADMTKSTFLWLFRTWLRAMGGQAPKVIMTEQNKAIKQVVEEVFPNSRHCFCFWHISKKIPDMIGYVTKRHDNFMAKFNKCVYKSWEEEDFERRWRKLVGRFELGEEEGILSLYEDRKKWVPCYLRDTFLAGMSISQRSESMNSSFDRYVTKSTTLKEFVEQYEVALHDRCEKEAHADFESWQTVLPLKSPSPYEKQMSSVYTRDLFKKFQIEVMGAHACHPVMEKEDEATVTFRVTDLEQQQEFIVTWNETNAIVSCSCLSFEFRGFLCRHTLIVLQFSGVFNIPVHYILKRWTKDAKNSHTLNPVSNPVESRCQRYNDLCKRAMKLAEEGSLSQESYDAALFVLEEGIKKCVTENDSLVTAGKYRALTTHNHCNIADKHGGLVAIPQVTKRKGASKRIQSGSEKSNKRKANGITNTGSDQTGRTPAVQETLQVMGQHESRAPNADSHFGTQWSLCGMEQLGSRASIVNNGYPTQDSYQRMWQPRPPFISGYYGVQQSLLPMGTQVPKAPNTDSFCVPQENFNGSRNR